MSSKDRENWKQADVTAERQRELAQGRVLLAKGAALRERLLERAAQAEASVELGPSERVACKQPAHGGAELNSTDGSLTLNFHQLEKLCDSQDRSIPITGAAVKEAIRTRPSDTLACMELAAHRVLSRRQPNLQLRVHVRIVDYPAKTKLKSLKANLIDNYFATKGTVVRVGNIRPMVTRMSFQCAKCGESVLRHFEGGKYNPPTSCPVDGCRSRTFAPDRDGCTTVDWQKIRLQEIVDDDREAGRIPRTVDVDLTNDLVDCCVPGDIVTVGGIVRSIKTEGDRGGGALGPDDGRMRGGAPWCARAVSFHASSMVVSSCRRRRGWASGPTCAR